LADCVACCPTPSRYASPSCCSARHVHGHVVIFLGTPRILTPATTPCPGSLALGVVCRWSSRPGWPVTPRVSKRRIRAGRYRSGVVGWILRITLGISFISCPWSSRASIRSSTTSVATPLSTESPSPTSSPHPRWSPRHEHSALLAYWPRSRHCREGRKDPPARILRGEKHIGPRSLRAGDVQDQLTRWSSPTPFSCVSPVS